MIPITMANLFLHSSRCVSVAERILRVFAVGSGFILLLAAAGCDRAGTPSKTRTASTLRMAVTTSTRDSGLLDQLIPLFESRHDAEILVIASGTGKALKLGENGDVDLVFVHAENAERNFVDAGHGVRREVVMQNYFTLAGPPEDPAQVRGLEAPHALKRLASTGASFVSRGDNSGTHQRELALWAEAGGRPSWPGYLESGRGMGVTLVMANEKQAYVLSDMGTYLAFRKKIRLRRILEEQALLRNSYGVLEVNPKKHANINQALARRFVDFLISPEAQRTIAAYQIDGHALFHPLHGPLEP